MAITHLVLRAGGADSILLVGGEDATEDFNIVHSEVARNMLNMYYIADLAPEGVVVPASQIYGTVGEAAPLSDTAEQLPVPPDFEATRIREARPGIPLGWPAPMSNPRSTTGVQAQRDVPSAAAAAAEAMYKPVGGGALTGTTV